MLFAVVLGATLFVASPGGSLIAPIVLGAVGVAIAIMGIPTVGVQGRKWTVLADALREHAKLVPYLQDARNRFPKSAPFPFSAPTDVVTIP